MSSASLVSGVDFVSIPTRDFGGALEFYGRVLGLRCRGGSPGRTHAEFDAAPVTPSVASIVQPLRRLPLRIASPGRSARITPGVHRLTVTGRVDRRFGRAIQRFRLRWMRGAGQ